jgi:hypothetical protein
MPDKPSGEQLDKIADALDRAQDIGLDVIQGRVTERGGLMSDKPSGRDARFEELLMQCSERGWDSYTAEPLTRDSVELAKKLFPAVQELHRTGMVAIVPCVEGGIQFDGVLPDGKQFEIQVWVDPEE